MATDRIVSLFDTAISPRFRRVERVREWGVLRNRLDDAETNAPVVARWSHDSNADKEKPGISEAQFARLRFELLVAGANNE